MFEANRTLLTFDGFEISALLASYLAQEAFDF